MWPHLPGYTHKNIVGASLSEYSALCYTSQAAAECITQVSTTAKACIEGFHCILRADRIRYPPGLLTYGILS